MILKLLPSKQNPQFLAKPDKFFLLRKFSIFPTQGKQATDRLRDRSKKPSLTLPSTTKGGLSESRTPDIPLPSIALPDKATDALPTIPAYPINLTSEIPRVYVFPCKLLQQKRCILSPDNAFQNIHSLLHQIHIRLGPHVPDTKNLPCQTSVISADNDPPFPQRRIQFFP